MRSLAFLTAILVAPAVQAAPVDLNDWTAESYASVSGFSPGVWTPAADGSSVLQSVNGQPTLYYSDFSAFGTEVSGKIRVNSGGGDDDFIGFVIGFQSGDTTNASADYLLIDWKARSQSWNFTGGTADATPGGNAPAGLAVSRVQGIPTADEFWQHVNYAEDSGGGVTELQRGATLSSTGWNFNVDYEFTFDFGPNNLQVFVDGVKELDILGTFSDGALGFYNFSQAQVLYSAFTVDEGSFPAPDPDTDLVQTPEPGVLALFGLGFVGLHLLRRRRI